MATVEIWNIHWNRNVLKASGFTNVKYQISNDISEMSNVWTLQTNSKKKALQNYPLKNVIVNWVEIFIFRLCLDHILYYISLSGFLIVARVFYIDILSKRKTPNKSKHPKHNN